MIQVGQKVRVLDAASFYFGREAVVFAASDWGDGVRKGPRVLSVEMPSGAGGSISFAVREDEAELA